MNFSRIVKMIKFNFFSVFNFEQLNKLFVNPKNGSNMIGKLENFDKVTNLQEYGFRGMTCTCKDLSCVCCVDLKLPLVIYKNTCTNTTYLPKEIGASISILVDNKVKLTKTISGT